MGNPDVFEDAQAKAREALGQAVVRALEAKGYKATYVPSREAALEEVLKLIPQGVSVGVPGSVTIREIGAMEKLKERGCTVYQHWDTGLSPEENKQARADEVSSDYFLTSTNAITRGGLMVNIDGTGNRLSAMAWGRNTLIFVVGVNKVVSDLNAAIKRSRSSTSANSIRLNLDTPCAKTGYCVDCDTPSRICRLVLILERAVPGRETHVIMVGEDLGF